MDESEPKVTRWTPVFERIPEDKRRRVLDKAKKAFAKYGYEGANVNLIARDAGISVGSLYQYFRTKEDLFLALIEEAHGLIATLLEGIFAEKSGFFDRVEAILRVAVESSSRDGDLVNLYIACTTEELSPFAGKLSVRIESVAAEMYARMTAEGKASGEVRADVPDSSAAFFMDNLFLIVQYSFGSAYYRERLKLFLGNEAYEDPEEVIRGTLAFIRLALAPR
jgi:TetR/AcrR family transcriptional regulator